MSASNFEFIVDFNLIHLKLGVIARIFPGRGEALYTDGLG